MRKVSEEKFIDFLHRVICVHPYQTIIHTSAGMLLSLRPPSGVRASGNWLFFVCEFVKMKKVVREFVKTISFVIRENKKYGS